MRTINHRHMASPANHMTELAPEIAVNRRAALAGGMRLAAVAIVASLGVRAAAAADKLAKSVVQYEETSTNSGKDCDDCAQFIPGSSRSVNGTCRIVAGDISPHGHCVAFTPLTKR